MTHGRSSSRRRFRSESVEPSPVRQLSLSLRRVSCAIGLAQIVSGNNEKVSATQETKVYWRRCGIGLEACLAFSAASILSISLVGTVGKPRTTLTNRSRSNDSAYASLLADCFITSAYHIQTETPYARSDKDRRRQYIFTSSRGKSWSNYFTEPFRKGFYKGTQRVSLSARKA